MTDTKDKPTDGSGVGYKKPPRHSRFKKGQSGNPRGRRRRERPPVTAMMAEELHTTVVITENGQSKRMTKLQLLFKRAVNQGISGRFQPIVLTFRIFEMLERVNQTPTKCWKDPLEDIDLKTLSNEELQKKLKEILART